MTAGCCSSENLSHFIKGSGYSLETMGCAIALIGLAAAVTTFAVGLLAWNGIFVYSVCIKAPLHLCWVIPVSLAFVAFEFMIIMSLADKASDAGNCLIDLIKESSAKVYEHFSAVHLCSPQD